MANSPSSRKRIRQNAKRRLLNRRRKEQLKQKVRAFEAAVGAAPADQATQAFRAAVKAIDQTSAKGAVHKNTAARKNARLAKRLAKLKSSAA